MMRLSSSFARLNHGWVAILATLIFILFMALVLPSQAAEAEEISGDAGSPDTSFWYSPDDLYRFAESYGEEGRAAYVRARWTFDLIYPLVYAFFLITTVSWTFAYVYPATSRWRSTNLIPFLGMVFDYLENSATSLVMARYPQSTQLVAYLAPILTLVKWFFVTGSFLLLFFGIIKVVHSHLKKSG
jgi:hypothetical protein